jgi:hypothetical protein
MKNLFSLFIVGMFVSCSSNVNIDVDPLSSNKPFVSSNFEIAQFHEDSLAKMIIYNGISAVNDKELISEPDIKFNSGYTDDLSFTVYQFSYKENAIHFIDTMYEKSNLDKRDLYLNNIRLNVCKMKDGTFDLDSMDMHIVYSESEFYVFENNPFYFLVISHPMNWVGTMTSFSFYQLINSKEKTVTEFIR